MARALTKEQQMTDDLRDCPGCGSERPFMPPHPEPGCCPDSTDGWCPEWFCTACGTALLAGVVPSRRDLTAESSPVNAEPVNAQKLAAGPLDRVA